jgi:hypothetical protein
MIKSLKERQIDYIKSKGQLKGRELHLPIGVSANDISVIRLTPVEEDVHILPLIELEELRINFNEL